MTLIPGLTLVKKPLESYLMIRVGEYDRDLTNIECEKLLRAAASHDQLLAAAKRARDEFRGFNPVDGHPHWKIIRDLDKAILAAEDPAR